MDRLTVRNCILRDAGEQLLKVPTTAGADYADNGLVVGCQFEYSAGVGPQYYIGGIDVHHGKGWIVRDNQFRSIRSPDDRIAEHAIHFWNDSRDTLVERKLDLRLRPGNRIRLGHQHAYRRHCPATT